MSPEDLYRVGEAARIGRVSVRTLHHYDAIGLLHPSHRGKGRYRFYTRSDLDRLHQIRLYQLFGLSLEEIGRVIDAPDFDARGALRQHRQRLMSEVAESRALIQTIDRLLDGHSVLASEELFLGFREEFWAVEASERWGEGSAWREAQERANGRDRKSLEKIRAEHQEILRKWSAAMRGGHGPTSEAATDVAERARCHVDRWFYPLSREAHVALGRFYVSDARFKEVYESVAEGLAQYVAESIKANRDRRGPGREPGNGSEESG